MSVTSVTVTPMKNWPPEKILRLIELYRENPVLWDPNHKDFKNTDVKNRLWNEIAEVIGSRDAEKKMNILVVQYRRELKKIRERIAAGKTEEQAATKWFAFEAMSFLKGKIRRQKQILTVTSPSVPVETTDTLEYCEQQNELRINKWRQNISTCVENMDFDYAGTTIKNSPDTQRDEYSAFGEMVAIKLRKMPHSYAKNKAMNLIINSLFQVEIECAESECEETEMVFVKTLDEDR